MHGTAAAASTPSYRTPRADAPKPLPGAGLARPWREGWASVLHVREYHPYWLPGRVRNPEFRDEDGRVLDLKCNVASGVAAAARDFARVLRPMLLPARTVLAVVPGHQVSLTNRNSPLGRVVASLVDEIGPRFLDGSDVLVRHHTIEKLVTGGERGPEVHTGSIRVARPELVAGRCVIVLDDVTTTGNSLGACRALLREAGATRVGALALARTA